ncbi:MAG: DUF1127 domain-containing protein [Reyranellaceae bacterium]
METMNTLPSRLTTTHRLDLSVREIVIAVVRLVVRAMVDSGKSIARWHEEQRQKQALRNLDQRMLDDIGLDPRDVGRAFRPSVWDRLG